MAARDSEDWSSDSNKALTICLLHPDNNEPKVVAEFHPKFTYPIFGDAQTIWGYQGLRVQLRFAAHDLQPNVKVWWNEKHPTVGEIAPLDIKQTLRDWLPDEAFGTAEDHEDSLRQDLFDSGFRPPGELLTRYRIRERKFEVWHGSLKDESVRAQFNRMQIFTPMFIEGGTYINFDDPEWSLERWRVFFLYEKLTDPRIRNVAYYSIMGYCTVYRYAIFFRPKKPSSVWAFTGDGPWDRPFELPDPAKPYVDFLSRERISQFVILPPYQHQGHGAAFYNALFNYFLADRNIYEVTVEDPNESFDDLRDFCDLARLRKHYPEFATLRLRPDIKIPKTEGAKLPTADILPIDSLEELRQKVKIAPRQFARLLELQLLSLTLDELLERPRAVRRRVGLSSNSTDQERAYRLWRLVVKQRIYKRSVDLLMQLNPVDRLLKLEETLEDLEADYLRILRRAGGQQIDDEQLQPIRPEDKVEEDEFLEEFEESESMPTTETSEDTAWKRNFARAIGWHDPSLWKKRGEETDVGDEPVEGVRDTIEGEDLENDREERVDDDVQVDIRKSIEENGENKIKTEPVKTESIEVKQVQTKLVEMKEVPPINPGDDIHIRMHKELREWNAQVTKKHMLSSQQKAEQSSKQQSPKTNPPADSAPQSQQPTHNKLTSPLKEVATTREGTKRSAPTASHDDDAAETDNDEHYETGPEEWDIQVKREPIVVDSDTAAESERDRRKREKTDKADRHVSKKVKC